MLEDRVDAVASVAAMAAFAISAHEKGRPHPAAPRTRPSPRSQRSLPLIIIISAAICPSVNASNAARRIHDQGGALIMTKTILVEAVTRRSAVQKMTVALDG